MNKKPDIAPDNLPGDDLDNVLDENGNVVGRVATQHAMPQGVTDDHAVAPVNAARADQQGERDPLYAPAQPPVAQGDPVEVSADEHARQAHARMLSEVRGNFHNRMRGKGFR